MVVIKIAALSVNKCWQGRRFKSKEYKLYEIAVLGLLPVFNLPSPPYSIHFTFGFSNRASDIDNPIKPMLDLIQKKYNINDKDIYFMSVKKQIVKKGEEFISFDISNVNGAIDI